MNTKKKNKNKQIPQKTTTFFVIWSTLRIFVIWLTLHIVCDINIHIHCVDLARNNALYLYRCLTILSCIPEHCPIHHASPACLDRWRTVINQRCHGNDRTIDSNSVVPSFFRTVTEFIEHAEHSWNRCEDKHTRTDLTEEFANLREKAKPTEDR